MEQVKSNYIVYSDGTIYSKKRKIFLKQEKVAKSVTYRRVTFSNNGITKRFFVHRLVAEKFIPNPQNKDYVNHIDNNGENNNASNLEWVTHKENMEHSSRQGRQDSVKKMGGNAIGNIRSENTLNKAKKILGSRLVSYNKGTTKDRGTITFNCINCYSEATTRTDYLKKNSKYCKKCKKEFK